MFDPKRPIHQFVYRGLAGLREAGKLREDLTLEEMQEEIGACLFGVLYGVYSLGDVERYEEKLRRLVYHLFSSFLKKEDGGTE